MEERRVSELERMWACQMTVALSAEQPPADARQPVR